MAVLLAFEPALVTIETYISMTASTKALSRSRPSFRFLFQGSSFHNDLQNPTHGRSLANSREDSPTLAGDADTGSQKAATRQMSPLLHPTLEGKLPSSTESDLKTNLKSLRRQSAPLWAEEQGWQLGSRRSDSLPGTCASWEQQRRGLRSQQVSACAAHRGLRESYFRIALPLLHVSPMGKWAREVVLSGILVPPSCPLPCFSYRNTCPLLEERFASPG